MLAVCEFNTTGLIISTAFVRTEIMFICTVTVCKQISASMPQKMIYPSEGEKQKMNAQAEQAQTDGAQTGGGEDPSSKTS